MTDKEKPASLEGRWDILYQDYPEIYEEFGQIPKKPDVLDVLVALSPWMGKWWWMWVREPACPPSNWHSMPTS